MRGGGSTRLVGALLVAYGALGASVGGELAAQSSQVARDDSRAEAATRGRERADRIEYEISRAVNPFVVDGVMDEAHWSDAVSVSLPWEVAPADNGRAPVTTECRLAYDVDHLYLGCTAHDPDPSAIRAYVVDRDAIDGHDRILLTLDPFNDQRRAFQFGISALGVQSDAVMAQNGGQGQSPGSADPSWDAIWESAGRITQTGYVVEAAIPFQSLRFPSGESAPWGAYLTRWWPRSANVQIRSASWDRSEACELCQANLVSGMSGITPGTNVQLTPTLTASKSQRREGGPSGPLTGQPTTGDAGLDAQWGVTSDLTLNVTVNPDFSQIEADVAQVEVNNRFALFYPEKRPFFLEGADFFATPVRAVFTRSIADPVGGAKLSGKVGASALGALIARDRATSLLLPGSQLSTSTVLEQPSTTGLARFRRDVGEASTIGALLTTRAGEGYHNRVAGADALFRPAGAVTVQAQLLGSQTRYPDAVVTSFNQPSGAFGGWGGVANATLDTRSWYAFVGGRYFDEGFRADAGFQSQVGVRGGSLMLQRRFWGSADRWFTQLRLETGAWTTRDVASNPLGEGIWVGLAYDGPGQTTVGVWPNLFMRDHFDGVTYEGMHLIYFEGRSAPLGSVTVGLNGDVGDVIDYSNGGLGRSLRLAPMVQLRLGRNVETELRHTYQRLDGDGGRIFSANVSQLRLVYNFGPRSFVRGTVQLRRTDRDPLLHSAEVDRRSTSLLGQALYAYKVNPQTVFFLGYGEDGGGSVDANDARTPFATRARTLFVKLGYAWRP
jgi:hypothetical protein